MHHICQTVDSNKVSNRNFLNFKNERPFICIKMAIRNDPVSGCYRCSDRRTTDGIGLDIGELVLSSPEVVRPCSPSRGQNLKIELAEEINTLEKRRRRGRPERERPVGSLLTFSLFSLFWLSALNLIEKLEFHQMRHRKSASVTGSRPCLLCGYRSALSAKMLMKIWRGRDTIWADRKSS